MPLPRGLRLVFFRPRPYRMARSWPAASPGWWGRHRGGPARFNGSREYLATLRDAYRAYIRELRLANKEAEAAEYLKRLRILDPGALLDGSVARGANPQPAPEAPRPTPTARAKIDDDP